MIRKWREHRFSILFVALLVMLLVVPALQRGAVGAIVVKALVTVILLSALYAVSENRVALNIAVALAVPTVVANWTGQLLGIDAVLGLGSILTVLLLAFTAKEILGHVVRSRRVTAEVIRGALCVYLLLGVIGAVLYTALEVWQPGAIAFPEGSGGAAVGDATRFSATVYYSFVTLTTLGYGDITPVTRLARTLSMVEAVTGQLYLAVLIARLVGLHIVHSSTSAAD